MTNDTRERPALPDMPLWKSLGVEQDGKGKPIINEDNILRVLELDQKLNHVVWYDEFYNKIMTTLNYDGTAGETPRQFTDTDNLHILTYMQCKLGLQKATTEVVERGVKMFVQGNRRNEPREWLESLSWDSESRIAHFFPAIFGAEDNEYARTVSRNFWVGMVARIYKPGCQLDNMVVLEGPQGNGKTAALRLIAGNWYAQQPANPYDKDFFLILQGRMIVEIDELDAFGRAEVTKIKSVITTTHDALRAPYERHVIDRPRMGIFVGTTNEKNWVRDQTGARRFWPIDCAAKEIDLDTLKNKREQFFAEAVSLYKAAATWWEINREAAQAEQEQRRQSDEWEQLVSDWLLGHPQGVQLAQVADEAIGLKADKFNMADQKRIAQAMRRAGWEKKHTQFGKFWYKSSVNGHDPSTGQLLPVSEIVNP